MSFLGFCERIRLGKVSKNHKKKYFKQIEYTRFLDQHNI